MSGLTAASSGRALAERQMTSTCTVFTAGEDVTDPVTGEVTHTQTTVWFGPCRVRPAGTQSSDVQAGGAELASFDYVISIPFSVTDVYEGHKVTITASADPALIGVTVRVRNVARGEVTARRLQCEEVA